MKMECVLRNKGIPWYIQSYHTGSSNLSLSENGAYCIPPPLDFDREHMEK